MQKDLEGVLDHAEGIIERAQRRPPKRNCSSTEGKSLHEKLYDLYVEECGKEPEVTEDLTRNVNLLEKLVTKENLPCLVVNLYPRQEGYSLMLKGENESYSETTPLPYEERDFLEYLDAEELPPVLVDLLEKSQVNIFHRGCVIAEVRDYRQWGNTQPPGYESRHVLLRPTMQTLACDVHSISSDYQLRTQEDRLLLESQLLLATAEPLCLDPSVSVACVANRLLYNKQKMNTPAMRRNFQRFSAASRNRQQELACSAGPPELRPHTFHRESTESQAGQQYDLKISRAGTCVDTWKQQPWDLEVPSEVDVDTYARGDWPANYDDTQPTVWPTPEAQDASLFGWEAGNPSQTTKPAIMLSLNDPFISGIRGACQRGRCGRPMFHGHSSTDDHSKSSMPGSKTNAGKAASQSKKLVQKSPKCPVREPQGSGASASLSQLSPGRAAAQPQAVSSPASVLGKGVQPTPPPSGLPYSPENSFSGYGGFIPLHASSFRESASSPTASRPPRLPQKSSVEVNPVSTFSAAPLSTASSSQTTLARQADPNSAGPKVIKVVGPVYAAQTVGRGSHPMTGSTARTKAPIAIKPRTMCLRGRRLPHILPALPKPPPQSVQYIFKNVSELQPITLLQLPASVILNPQQQPLQQPQQQPLQQPQQMPQQQPWQKPQQQPRQQPQQMPQQQPRQKPQQQPLQMPQQQPRQQPQQMPQQQPWQKPQQQPRQQPQQMPQQQPWQKPQQQPLQMPQQQPRQQPQQMPQQQPWQKPQQQPLQQPQQQPQQRLKQEPQRQPKHPQQFYQLIPQQLQQPVPTGSSTKGSTRQRTILPALPAAVIDPNEVESILQPQMAAWSQPSSTQTRPEQSPPQQSVLLSSAFQQVPQSQPVPFGILQLPVTVPTVETPNSSATWWPADSKPVKR